MGRVFFEGKKESWGGGAGKGGAGGGLYSSVGAVRGSGRGRGGHGKLPRRGDVSAAGLRRGWGDTWDTRALLKHLPQTRGCRL